MNNTGRHLRVHVLTLTVAEKTSLPVIITATVFIGVAFAPNGHLMGAQRRRSIFVSIGFGLFELVHPEEHIYKKY